MRAKAKQMKRCEAETKKGKVCSKSAVAKSTVSGKNLCTLHLKLEPDAQEPWVELKLMAPSTENRKLVLAKIRRKLRSTKDGGGSGSIYIYAIASEVDLNYWKVGMTERTADERLSEWSDEHKARIIKMSEYRVEHSVKLVERLVHLYLDYCRMYRTPCGHGCFLSVLSATGKVIEDKQYEKIKDEGRPAAKNKHVEFFNAPLEDIKAVIEAIVGVHFKSPNAV